MKVKNRYKKELPWAYAALERDNFSCQKCYITENLVVHHLDESRKFGWRKMNNELSNLITLCRHHHAEIHGRNIVFKNPKANLIKELRLQGRSYQSIAEYIGVSRQRIHQIIKKSLT